MSHSTCKKCGNAISNDFSKYGSWYSLDERGRAWKCSNGEEHEPRPKSANLKKRLVGALSVAGKTLFYIQLLVFAWFTGAIERNEQSPYGWIEYSRHLHRLGPSDALLVGFLYLLYYCFLVEDSAFVLWRLLIRGKPADAASIRRLVICSCWVLFTFLALGNSIFQFMRNLPTDVMNGWLVIGWIASTVVAGMSFWHLLSARLEDYRQSSLGYRYEQFLDRHGLLGQFFEEEAQKKKRR